MLLRISDLKLPGADELLEKASEISSRYDNWIESDEGDGGERAPGIHASELKCVRQVVYTLLAVPKRGSKKKVWRQKFQVGHAVHDMIQTDFEQMARDSKGRLQFTREVKIAPDKQALAKELEIHSSCDGVFTLLDLNEREELEPFLRIGLEIKTDSPDIYDKRQKPNPEHIVQAHVYMKLLDLPIMWFLYMNKGNQNNTPSKGAYLISFDEALWADIEKRCNTALNYAAAYEETKELPLREEGIHCDFCPYGYTCQPKFLERRNGPRWPTLGGL